MPNPTTGTGAGFDTPLPAGGAPIDATTGLAIDPSVLAADKATSAARSAADQAQQEYQQAAAAFDGVDPTQDVTGEVRKTLATRVDTAQRALAEARSRLADAYTRTADATSAAQARVASSRNNDPSLNDYYESHATQAKADSALAQAQADAVTAKTPTEIAQAQAAVSEATARAQSLGILTPAQAAQANAAAVESNARATNIAALTPSQVRATNATAANTEATTGTLIPSQAALNDAQARVAQANAGLSDAQTQEIVGKTGPEIDQLVAQGHLNQAQADLVKAQIPGEQATTAKTEAETQQLKLGSLYGVQDRINAMRDAIASGSVTPEQANDQLNQYIQSQIQAATTGATQFDRNNAALTAETQRRQQDTSLAGTQASSYGSGFSSALGTFQKLNDTTPVGSDAAGRGFLASMQELSGGLKSFQPSAPADSPLLQSMRAPVSSGPTPPSAAPSMPAPAPAPTTTIAPDGTVTVQHVSAGAGPAAPSGPSPDYLFNSAASPIANAANTPSFLQNQRSATPSDVAALWAGDPHFDPNQQGSVAAASSGAQ